MVRLRLTCIEQVVPTLILVVSHVAESGPGIVGNSQNRHDQHTLEKCFHRVRLSSGYFSWWEPEARAGVVSMPPPGSPKYSGFRKVMESRVFAPTREFGNAGDVIPNCCRIGTGGGDRSRFRFPLTCRPPRSPRRRSGLDRRGFTGWRPATPRGIHAPLPAQPVLGPALTPGSAAPRTAFCAASSVNPVYGVPAVAPREEGAPQAGLTSETDRSAPANLA